MCVNVIMMRDSDAVAAPHLATPFMGLQYLWLCNLAMRHRVCMFGQCLTMFVVG